MQQIELTLTSSDSKRIYESMIYDEINILYVGDRKSLILLTEREHDENLSFNKITLNSDKKIEGEVPTVLSFKIDKEVFKSLSLVGWVKMKIAYYRDTYFLSFVNSRLIYCIPGVINTMLSKYLDPKVIYNSLVIDKFDFEILKGVTTIPGFITKDSLGSLSFRSEIATYELQATTDYMDFKMFVPQLKEVESIDSDRVKLSIPENNEYFILDENNKLQLKIYSKDEINYNTKRDIPESN